MSLDAFVVLSVVVFKDFQAIICATQILMWFTFTTVRCVLSFSYHYKNIMNSIFLSYGYNTKQPYTLP